MKLYVSTAEIDTILHALQGKTPVSTQIEARQALYDKLSRIKARPVVGAINTTGEIEEFADVTHFGVTLDKYQVRLPRFPRLEDDGTVHSYIDRNAMIKVLRQALAPFDVMEVAKALRHFPTPNPKLEGDKNALDQTEDEFWQAVDGLMDGVS